MKKLMRWKKPCSTNLIERNSDVGNYIPGIQYQVSLMPGEPIPQIPAIPTSVIFYPRLYAFIRQDYNPCSWVYLEYGNEMYCKDKSGKNWILFH
jgi:hypothetical protein